MSDISTSNNSILANLKQLEEKQKTNEWKVYTFDDKPEL